MILSMIVYSIDPDMLTAVLSAVLGVLLIMVACSIGILYLKKNADTKKMSKDEYKFEKRNVEQAKSKKEKKKNKNKSKANKKLK